jgi:putative transposase
LRKIYAGASRPHASRGDASVRFRVVAELAVALRRRAEAAAMEALVHLSHSVGQNCFHLIWKPKWSKDPFKFFSVRAVCAAAIRRAAYRSGMRIIELEVMPDHVHCFVNLPSTMSVAAALQRLKGYSAYMIFKHHPWLRRHFRTGHLWSPGKFFRSVGAVTADAIQHYIAESNRGSREQKLLTRYPAL